jgi:hypothetical protein
MGRPLRSRTLDQRIRSAHSPFNRIDKHAPSGRGAAAVSLIGPPPAAGSCARYCFSLRTSQRNRRAPSNAASAASWPTLVQSVGYT